MPNLRLWDLLEQLEIRTKDAQIIKLDRNAPFAWAQREFVAEVERQYNAGLPVRIIVLKGRQVGISTVTEAILFLWGFIHPHSFSLVLSMEKDDSAYLLEMTKRYWTSGPFYGLFGLGMALYFASQGAGRLLWPLVANVGRLVVASGGGWLVLRLGGTMTHVFVAQGVALAVFGLINAAAVAGGSWFGAVSPPWRRFEALPGGAPK